MTYLTQTQRTGGNSNSSTERWVAGWVGNRQNYWSMLSIYYVQLHVTETWLQWLNQRTGYFSHKNKESGAGQLRDTIAALTSLDLGSSSPPVLLVTPCLCTAKLQAEYLCSRQREGERNLLFLKASGKLTSYIPNHVTWSPSCTMKSSSILFIFS